MQTTFFLPLAYPLRPRRLRQGLSSGKRKGSSPYLQTHNPETDTLQCHTSALLLRFADMAVAEGENTS